MRSNDYIMRQHVPHYNDMKRVEKLQNKAKQNKRKHDRRLTEMNYSGKAVLKGKTTVTAAIMKLFKYEETGLQPHEIEALLERERNLTERIKKMEGWENE